MTDGMGQVVATIQQLDYENYLMRYRVIDAIFGTIAPLFTSLLIACRLRKEPLISLAVSAIVKFVSLFFCVQIFGMAGATMSNLLSYLTIIVMDVYYLNRQYKINWHYTLRKILVMCCCLLLTSFVYLGLYAIFGDITRFGRIEMIPLLVLEGMIVLGVYVALTYFFQLPQQLFHIDLKMILRKLKRR